MDAANRPVPPRRTRRRAAYNARRLTGIDPAALQRAADRRTDGPAPGSAEGRWVPIGPSVVLGGEASDRPRYSGRIKDVAVDPTGTRAYAAAAMGGVWYTGDGGASWAPVGGGAVPDRLPGGVADGLTCGCLLVAFGPAADQDVVLVGTGTPEPVEAEYVYAPGGVGVLAAIGPAGEHAAAPWEPATGLDQFGGAGFFRLVRDPATTPGRPGDRIVACTGKGLFVGVRGAGAYRWRAVPGFGFRTYDASWLADGRILVTAAGDGSRTRLLLADLDGGEPVEITLPTRPSMFAVIPGRTGDKVEPPSVTGIGRLARATGDRHYLLALVEGWLAGNWVTAPALWRIDDPSADPYAVEPIDMLAADNWGDPPQNLRVIAVDSGAADTVYLGGTFYVDQTSGESGAQLFRSPVTAVPFTPEYLGTRVHADLHAIQITGPPDRRQVWLVTDGGVFVSTAGGDRYTYTAVNTGIASLEPEFARSNPVHGSLVAAGTQDNGTDIRTGDTTWEMYAEGDGGGLAFLPHAPHVLVYQYTNAFWGTGWNEDNFVDPLTRNPGWPNFPDEYATTDPENAASNFYSGAATIRLTPEDGPEASRLAIGTDRVWITDDLPAEPERANTWRVLPYPGGREYDPRADWTFADPRFDQGFGTTGLGPLFTLAWAGPDQLIAVFDQGVVRWSAETDDRGRSWQTETWARWPDGPWPAQAEFTDLSPIPGTSDFYVTTTGLGDEETVWRVTDAGQKPDETTGRTPFVPAPTGFAARHGGPRDPVFAIVLHPAQPEIVFVGTVTGVWRGEPGADGSLGWTPYRNGLPQAIVQDLHTWTDPDSGTWLLRAALASRGLWEVDLGADARRETWIRAAPYDDRRTPLVRDADPWRPDAGRAPATLTASPDITVRPAWPVPAVPPFPGELTRGGRPGPDGRGRRNRPRQDTAPEPDFNLWTFQTAFRWQHPSVPASGFWSDNLENLLPESRDGDRKIDRDLWDAVVGARIGGGPFAVFRPPWQTETAPHFAATEADLMELVVPVGGNRSDWAVYPGPSTVDVLLHHRDSRAVAAGDASVTLLWQFWGMGEDPMDADPADLLACLTGTGRKPDGWQMAHRELAVPLDARLPRAVSIDVNLSELAPGSAVLFLAYVESEADDRPRRPPSLANPATLTDLVRSWPSLAARRVRIVAPPMEQPEGEEPDERR